MPSPFQPQAAMHPNSPYRQPAQLAQQPGMQYPGGPHMPYGYQQVRIPPSHSSRHISLVSEQLKSPSSADSSQSSQVFSQSDSHSTAPTEAPDFRMPAEGDNGFLQPFSSFPSTIHFDQYLTAVQQQPIYGVPHVDPYGNYFPQPSYGMQQSMYAPPVPNSPRMGYHMPSAPYGQPQTAPGMSRTPSNMSERPSSAVAQPSTPAMTNVNHVSHAHTPSSVANSPAPNTTSFTKPPKASKAIVIKTADGEVLNFDKKAISPAPPTQPRSPAIVSTPTPPPRAPSATESSHSRTESVITKTDKEKQAEFVKQFQEKLRLDKEKEESDKKEKAEAESKAQRDKEEAASKAQKDKEAAEAKAQKEKEEAEAKAQKEKEEAEAKVQKQKEEAEAKAQKEKAEAEAKAKQEAEEKEKAEAEEKAKSDADEKKRLDDEEMERLIAELEAQEKEEAAKEAAYQEKKAKETAEKKKREAEDLKREDEKLRQQEKEAEERELARMNETPEQKAERENLFASLKKNTMFGPSTTDSGSSTPTAEPAPPAPSKSPQPRVPGQPKPKPAALQLDTKKSVEPAQPTAGMQSLKSARFLQIKNEAINYPEGIQSPNPALNVSSRAKGRQYDKDFLLQFQEVFKEKPSVDWDMKLKETVGDSSDSARPQSARPAMGSMGPRQTSSRGGAPAAMGQFGAFGGRTLPPGTTSEQRFQQASGFAKPNPIAPFIGGGNRGGAFPMAAPMARSSSFQQAPNSPRVGSSRGRGGSRRGGESKKDDHKSNSAMPLTVGMELKPLNVSQTGWKPISLVAPATAQPPATGLMAPDMVQRKVKAALNKMTPEKFDKIADQILEIAAQSAQENDGRTVRQVIALTFEKACDEAHWASMYAKFCHRMLSAMSTEIKDENVKDKHGAPVVGGALFRKYLLNRCQEEFERGWEVNLPDKPEGQADETRMLSEEYYIAAAAKRKGLGLIQFIGELYKLSMLTLRIMHECVLKLLDFEGLPDESAIESLVKLLRTVGATMESTEAGPKMIGMYFERIDKIMKMEGLPSRLQYMLLDTIDLRKAGWKSKDDAKGPKTIGEIRQEAVAAQQAAEMERNRTSQRGGPRLPMGGRGDARSFSGNMPPPQDFPSGRVQMDDLRKLSKGSSGRNVNGPSQLGPSMLGARSGSGRRGLGPGGLGPQRDESGASSRTATPPQKDKESTTHMNSFRYVSITVLIDLTQTNKTISALAALENEGAGEVGSPPDTASSAATTAEKGA
jgi:translation initiation factor 4G